MMDDFMIEIRNEHLNNQPNTTLSFDNPSVDLIIICMTNPKWTYTTKQQLSYLNHTLWQQFGSEEL